MTPATAHLTSVDIDAALDVEQMSTVIGDLPVGATQVVSAEVVDHKHGRRALLRYYLGGSGSPSGETLLGKLYADPARAKRVHDLMACLDRAVFADIAELGVPEVLGWRRVPPLVLYRPASGLRLDEVDEERQVATMRAAAHWLARLHRSRVVLDRTLDVGHEVANATRWAGVVSHELPAAAAAATAVTSELHAAQPGLQVRTDVPIHKDFHHQHLILGRDRLTVVDLDEARLGDPAFDVAHFVANLELSAIRSGRVRERSAQLPDTFLATYAAETGWSPDERFSFFSRYTALKIAKQLALGSGLRPRPGGAERDRQARKVLAWALEATP